MRQPPADDQLDAALAVGRVLDRLGVDWMICGSVASSHHGIPRSTHDTDLVAALTPASAAQVAEALSDAFYVDPDVARDAAARSGSFNAIHFASVSKVDVFVAGSHAFRREGLSARVIVDLPGHGPAPIASAEHMVVAKLWWYRQGGEVSERQLDDVRGILRVAGAAIDLERARVWAVDTGVSDLLEAAIAAAADS